MNAQYPIPEYVDTLLDLAALRDRTNAQRSHGMRPAANARPPVGTMVVTLAALGLATSVIVTTTLASVPANRTNAIAADGGVSFSEQIKRNTAALRRSRAWWEGYGQKRWRSPGRTATVNE
jgi:hypothetical protein